MERLHKKDVWRFSTTVSGEQYVMMGSLMQQQELSATRLDLGMCSMTRDSVSVTHFAWPHRPENPPGRPRAQWTSP